MSHQLFVFALDWVFQYHLSNCKLIDKTTDLYFFSSPNFFPPDSTRTAPMISPCRYRVKCCSSVVPTAERGAPDLVPTGVVQWPGFQLPVIRAHIKLPPVSVAHHNREDYIADTTLDFVRNTYLLVGSVQFSNSCCRQPSQPVMWRS